MRDATAEEIGNWDELIKANPDRGNVLQCKAFGEMKSRHGWQSKHLIYDLPQGEIAALYLIRSVPGFGALWYAPKGPGVASVEQFKTIVGQTLDSPAFLVKFEPELKRDLVTSEEITSMKLIKSGRDIQLNSATVLVDLKPSEDDIIGSFKQKTRYNIRLAERKGVKVEAVDVTPESINQMYTLMQSTYARAGVYTRSKQYFSDFWELHAQAACGQLFFATYEGKVQAGAFITHLGEKALYKDGASSREHSDLQAPYLLQWEVMRWLKSHGVREYDLHGTPPTSELENPNHPLASLARFKMGFNAEITEFIGTYDLPIDRSRYRAWLNFGERAAEMYNFRLRQRLFY